MEPQDGGLVLFDSAGKILRNNKKESILDDPVLAEALGDYDVLLNSLDNTYVKHISRNFNDVAHDLVHFVGIKTWLGDACMHTEQPMYHVMSQF
ncbi:hypothetical protein TSUD_332690 [Trifolium subterraneum]|uniref:Uncharacterized protein n=1 Tax=Trifolium subterraneum TaxID=3900 RepID=A0A2Z6MG27_TRISU|nr:hypothetical protein TSUD_332690 [Trifolium subterraneum]